MNLLETYKTHYQEFTQIDDFNLEEKTKKIPSEKQFWVARLIDSKIEKDKLISQKKKLKNSLIKKMMDNSPVNLDKKTLDKLDNIPQIEEIDEKIKEYEYLIEYLELVVKNMSYIAQDIKNIISIKELERL